MRIVVLFVVSTLLSFSMIAQETPQVSRPLNLPPGYSIPPKTDLSLDYSIGIQKLPAVAPSDFVPGDFLMAFGLPTIREKMAASPEFNTYCQAALTFYNQLSNRVKSTYSMSELWYIYMYDIQLAERLLTINDPKP